ncbi:MAG: tRNA (adenosine(37)-N6)-threonylcarbamoyltransferase complex transferase subunit TsaD [Candidatus Omnitrophica bacterium]|nr:tRNA (adenosine(37)-N6)-threonylcarbamoyltransferase complex transferase subunit TsaD [Candidatus Omnitrophota bacterium]
MKVLGIETSCDETAAAVVENGKHILSSVIISSLSYHRRFGGIIPEIAFRKQLEAISFVVQEALTKADISYNDIELIAYTQKPGLIGSLLVGISFAHAIGTCLNIPCLGVDHIHSHIFSCLIKENPLFPLIALVVSGGHTSLYYLSGYNRFKFLGATKDDACGEAFDKVAKILNLGYPGGPAIEREARNGNPLRYKFKCSNTKLPFEFSFSGIKTAVLYETKKYRKIHDQQKKDICASFQYSIFTVLIKKAIFAANSYRVKTIVVGGGVAANNFFRQLFDKESSRFGLRVVFAPKELCTDNAAMVAAHGYFKYKKF